MSKQRYVVISIGGKATLIRDTKRFVIVCETFGQRIDEAEKQAAEICELLNHRAFLHKLMKDKSP